MADSNLLQFSFLRESTWGTTPSSAFQAIPVTGSSMAHGVESIRSQQKRSDAQLAELKKVGEAPTASFDFELTADAYDDFMRSAVRSDADWSTSASISGATDISAAATGNKFESSSTNFTSSNITKGQWIYVSGFTLAANNGWFKVTTVAASALTVSFGTLSNEAAGDSITIAGSYICSGSTEHSYTLQQQFTDLTDRYHTMTGSRINSFSLSQTPNGIITGSAAFDGKQRAQGSSKAGNGSVTAAASKSVAAEVDGFDEVFIGGSALSIDVMELSLNIAIPNRPAKGLGNTARTRMPQGSPEITGSLMLYLDDDSWTYDTSWQAFTKQSLAFTLNMGSDERYCFELPNIAFTSEPQTSGGLDSDVMLQFGFAAEPAGSFGSSSLEKTIIITRV